jgi:hypothetical protein
MIRLFVAVYLVGALAVFGRQVAVKIAFIRRGRPEDRTDNIGRRVWIFFSEVIGQTRVRERLTAGWAHALVFWGFLAFMVSTVNLLWRLAVEGEGLLHGPLALVPPVVDVAAFLIILGLVTLGVRRYVVRPASLTYHSIESAVVLFVIGIIAATHLGERYYDGMTSIYFGYAHLVVSFSFLAYRRSTPCSSSSKTMGRWTSWIWRPSSTSTPASRTAGTRSRTSRGRIGWTYSPALSAAGVRTRALPTRRASC